MQYINGRVISSMNVIAIKLHTGSRRRAKAMSRHELKKRKACAQMTKAELTEAVGNLMSDLKQNVQNIEKIGKKVAAFLDEVHDHLKTLPRGEIGSLCQSVCNGKLAKIVSAQLQRVKQGGKLKSDFWDICRSVLYLAETITGAMVNLASEFCDANVPKLLIDAMKAAESHKMSASDIDRMNCYIAIMSKLGINDASGRAGIAYRMEGGEPLFARCLAVLKDPREHELSLLQVIAVYQTNAGTNSAVKREHYHHLGKRTEYCSRLANRQPETSVFGEQIQRNDFVRDCLQSDWS